METLALSQISELARILEKDENLNNHFDMNESFDKLYGITVKQYNLILSLLRNKHYRASNGYKVGLNDILIQLGFVIKQ